jgi:hypothetical protein
LQRADWSRRAAPVRATARTDSRFEHGPLGVGQVHAVEYDGDHTAVSGGFRIYETASRVAKSKNPQFTIENWESRMADSTQFLILNF